MSPLKAGAKPPFGPPYPTPGWTGPSRAAFTRVARGTWPALQESDLSDLRFRDRVIRAVRLRIETIEDKEALRRAMSQNALPLNAPDGARMLWQTADHIWNALGDTSDDYNWYTKRMTLSGVIGATLLFWLGDDSPDQQATWEFLDRRVDNVMQFEKVKGQLSSGPLGRLLAGPASLLGGIKPPRSRDDLPGHRM